MQIEIDGKAIQANIGEMLINVTDREGINLPRFCYHKKLSIVASCRMCLVDIEGIEKPKPACSTPIVDGMKVYTQSDKTKTAQKAVMEFLLINHPLDCPICDQGGECELQDVALGYGTDVSHFSEGKRIVTDGDIGALIQTDMTRCIHCTRCVRFGTEIAGMMEMGATGRGENLKIESFLTQSIDSELSGNMIDVCPVGALTSKPFRYELRSWQLTAVNGVARHDLVGSTLYVQTYKNKVKRIVSGDNEAINETWIADRDRFSYQGLCHSDRLLTPNIKITDRWKTVTWNVALDYALKGLQRQVLNNANINQLGALAGSTSSVEEFYLLQKVLRELGCNNMDYRLNVKDLTNTITLNSNIKLSALETVNHALIVGSNLKTEQPMINHRLRKASLQGASIEVINIMEFNFNYPLHGVHIIKPNKISMLLAGILKSVLQSIKQPIPDYLTKVVMDKSAKQMAAKLLKDDNTVIILGEHVVNTQNAVIIANLITQIAKHTHSATLNLSANANSLAAELTGFKPTDSGMNANEMLKADMRAFILLDVYPDYDCHDPNATLKALTKDDTFVIALNSFYDKTVADYADVLLPMASFYETSGTQININKDMQSYQAAISAPESAKPAWKILKVLADLLELTGFDYTNSTQILNEVASKPDVSNIHDISLIPKSQNQGVEVIWQVSPYAIDALLRHSTSLQQTSIGQINAAYMNAQSAKLLALSNTDTYLGVPVVITQAVADDCVFINSNQAKNVIN